MGIEYELPENQVEDMKKGWHNLQLAEDILVKLRTAGQPNAEAEARLREIKDRTQRFAAAFKVDLTED